MLMLFPTAMMMAQAAMVASVAASFALPAMAFGTAQAIAAAPARRGQARS